MTKAEAKAYFAKLATDAGLPEDQVKAVATALEHEKFGDEVAKSVLLEADYSREKRKLAEQAKANVEYYERMSKFEQEHRQTVADAQRIQAALYQQPTQTITEPTQTPSGFSKEEIAKLLDERDQRLASGVSSLVKNAVGVSQDYLRRFGTPLDVEEFDKYIGEARTANPNVDINSAYKQYIEPQLEKQRAMDIEKRIEAARKEEREAILSKHHFPVDPGPKQFAPAWDPQRFELAKMPAEQQEDHAREAFFKGWAEAESAPSR